MTPEQVAEVEAAWSAFEAARAELSPARSMSARKRRQRARLDAAACDVDSFPLFDDASPSVRRNRS